MVPFTIIKPSGGVSAKFYKLILDQYAGRPKVLFKANREFGYISVSVSTEYARPKPDVEATSNLSSMSKRV